MNIRPIDDRILVKAVEAETTSKGGIALVNAKASDQSAQATVLAVGKGSVQEDGTRRPVDVQVGDVVVYKLDVGSEIKHEGVKYTVLRESELLAVIAK